MQSLAIQLGDKTVTVDVEVVDAPLDYNLLLGRSWFYAMTTVALSVFLCVQFPHQGKIVTIDQLDFRTPTLASLLPTTFLFWETTQLRMKALVLAY